VLGFGLGAVLFTCERVALDSEPARG
jgi:hypothetical protein